MIAAYLLKPSASTYRLKDLYKKYFEEHILDYTDKEGKDHINTVAPFWRLADYKPIREELSKKGMLELFNNIEMPLIEVLADMEYTGFKIDIGILKELSLEFTSTIEEITKKIHNYAGEEFNINSTKQLSEILFDKLGLTPVKKTKTGYSTDVKYWKNYLMNTP